MFFQSPRNFQLLKARKYFSISPNFKANVYSKFENYKLSTHANYTIMSVQQYIFGQGQGQHLAQIFLSRLNFCKYPSHLSSLIFCQFLFFLSFGVFFIVQLIVHLVLVDVICMSNRYFGYLNLIFLNYYFPYHEIDMFMFLYFIMISVLV